MSLSEYISAECPYCGEMLELLVDCSLDSQQYVEDCHVCCQPIVVNVKMDSEMCVSVEVSAENC